MISFIGLIFCNIFNVSAEFLKVTFCIEIGIEAVVSLLYMRYLHGGIFKTEKPRAETFDTFEDVRNDYQIDAPKTLEFQNVITGYQPTKSKPSNPPEIKDVIIADYSEAICWNCPRIRKVEGVNPYVEGTCRWYAFEEARDAQVNKAN